MRRIGERRTGGRRGGGRRTGDRRTGDRRIGTGLKKTAVLGGTALALGLSTPYAFAAAAQYAQWNIPAGPVTVPAKNFPVGHISTDSTAPASPSGQSAFLNASTPFGQAFGSSQGQPYALLHLAAGRQPSTTKVADVLPNTGAGDIVALGVLAATLLAAGFVLTIGVQRVERAARDEA